MSQSWSIVVPKMVQSCPKAFWDIFEKEMTKRFWICYAAGRVYKIQMQTQTQIHTTTNTDKTDRPMSMMLYFFGKEMTKEVWLCKNMHNMQSMKNMQNMMNMQIMQNMVKMQNTSFSVFLLLIFSSFSPSVLRTAFFIKHIKMSWSPMSNVSIQSRGPA